MTPAPPVTRMLRVISPVQAEQPLERLQHAVAPASLRRRFEGERGGVKKLVEQGLAEVLDLGPIVRAKLPRPRHHPTTSAQATLTHAAPRFLDTGHNDQAPVPPPKRATSY